MTLSVVFTAKIQNNLFVQAVKINFWKMLRAKIRTASKFKCVTKYRGWTKYQKD